LVQENEKAFEKRLLCQDKMKVIHIPFGFHPDPIGGTEVYVESLARHLQAQGVQIVIAAPGGSDEHYAHDGLPVRRFSVTQTVTDVRELYGEGDARAAQGFARILEEEWPDVAHLHAFTRGVSLALVRHAKRRGIPVVFTYHTPTVSCQRGTLMRWGREVCDGTLDLHPCARCTLHSLGLNRFLSRAVGGLPPTVGRLTGSVGLSGGLWTALRMTDLVQLRHSAFRALMAEVDHVVALCQWAKDLLLHNGVPAAKIMMSQHGLSQPLGDKIVDSWKTGGPEGYDPGQAADEDHQENTHSDILASQLPSEPPRRGRLRIAFLGRLDPTKGPDLLIQALRWLRDAQVTLHLYGIVQGAGGIAYLQQLKAMAAGDPRIVFLPPVASDRVISLLRGYHLLAVPSRWLETGPLVVLEAFAAGIPVIGSNLGGIAELVEHEVNGLLVAPDSPVAWRQALGRLAEDRSLLQRLRAGIRPPRTMEEVAVEMLALYHTLCDN
jgi:glycosyltransferase involved in cell wall biosynthesis